MLTKFETKSNRVKGLAFHPKRPWVLSSLHSGVIQLWDFRMGTLIDRFDEHEGPVRGVHFHPGQPLFVSGGDDYKVKVWNYNLRRCLFTLLGHLDYIRTVQFHHEHPWIMSASDDQTIRIWNWQSRQCISVLTGHNHYVMCALFHPREDLVVSASLDQTVRVWDITGLRKKYAAPGSGGATADERSSLDGFGEAVVKYVLEGHDRGVNWASFHPTLPLIVSGADDRQVKLWRMNDTKAWEVDTLRGHTNNVSCVFFHARQDLIVSNSEDRTIRVWDMSKRTGVQTFRREQDRFWILAAHSDVNLLAAGHDSGMIVFKLERERPAFAVHQGQLFYVKDRYLRLYDFATQRDNPLLAIRRPGTTALNSAPRHMSYNPAERAVLLTSDVDDGTYELYILPRDAGARGGEAAAEPRVGSGAGAVFIARNRFAVLDKSTGSILIKNMHNEVTKKIPCPSSGVDAIFPATTGCVLLRIEDRAVLFDLQTRAVVGEVHCPQAKYAVWSHDMSKVALLSKHAVVLADRKLKTSVTVHETIRVKSAAWEESGVLIYGTLNHIKYCLTNGDTGIIKSLDAPIYITQVTRGVVNCLDRDGQARQIAIDPSEHLFKQALAAKRHDVVLSMIKSGALCGSAIVAYLRDKGYPEVALHLVQGASERFNLAVDCGNIEVAMAAAHELDTKDAWYRLGVEALRQGNHQIVEFCYQKTKALNRLSFLYLVTGNRDKLGKMLRVAGMREDVMLRFQNALYLGDVGERVRCLAEAGLTHLAYACAASHGLEEEAKQLAEALEDAGLSVPEVPEDAELMLPPPPVRTCAENWPLVSVERGMFDQDPSAAGAEEKVVADEGGATDAMGEAAGAWGGDDGPLEAAAGAKENGAAPAEAGGGGGGWGDEDEFADIAGGLEDVGDAWGDDEDLDLDLDVGDAGGAAAPAAGAAGGVFVVPTPGPTVAMRWSQSCGLAGEFAAAGDFAGAMRLLNRQLGVVDFAPYGKLMLDVHLASFVPVAGLPCTPPLSVQVEHGWDGDAAAEPPKRPRLPATLATLDAAVRAAYKLVTEGKFHDAVDSFERVLLQVTLLSLDSLKEAQDAEAILRTCREYIIGLKCELKRKEVAADPKRATELAAYFTHCQLQPIHQMLALRSAMTSAFKLKNLATSATFARRLLELGPSEKMAAQARQVLAACEKNLADEVDLQYDPRTPFDVCAVTWTPVYRGKSSATCPLSGARFQPQCAGQVSPIGGVARIGAEGTGLIVSQAQLR
ncbi:unnamed protein product [Pedinophyceae sp. YPF-701]|nr:unnamed protein product [Pedinophyceae sp. YPF-701]